jgi:hypothetical protein
MNIAVLGTGNIGGTLGRKWAAAGHTVVFGTREPEGAKAQALLAEVGHGATAASVLEAVSDAEVVVFAIPGGVMAETVAQLGSRLNGKILIDTTNRVGQPVMHSLDLLREAAPDSPLFRAFSTLGWENFANPVIAGMQVDLFYAGDSGAAQMAVDALVSEIGLRPIYVGGVEQAPILDGLTRLWFVTAIQQANGRRLAFKMIVE